MKKKYLKTIRRFYPNAFYAGMMEKEILEYLKRVGFKPEEVMAANSVCSDDVNAMQFSISDTGLLGPFYLGGIRWFSFHGTYRNAGVAHHMPEEGALLIYFGPHIGITKKGVIGKIRRVGQDHDSDCCGAARAALNRINDLPQAPTVLDYQQDNIVTLFQMHKQRIEAAKDPIKEATEVMYESIAERIHLLIDHSKDTFKAKHAILIGSVFINVDEGSEACVDQRLFKTINLKTGKVVSHKEKFDEYIKSL